MPEPGGRQDLLPILIARTGLALWMVLSGESVLHASAVAEKGLALAFVGQSGRGQSTSAALCAAAGARLVSDDVLRIDTMSAPPRCIGSGGELRLRDKARDLVNDSIPTAHIIEPRTRELHSCLTRPTPTGSRLGAIVVSRPSVDANDIEVERIAASKAICWLLAMPRVEGLRPPDLGSS